MRPGASSVFSMTLLRPVVSVRHGNGVKLMTYNVLAQCLVNRKQFPSSGKYLRWAQRSQAFALELDEYDPEILFLQEIDNSHRKFWIDLLQPRGYESVFYSHPSKKHGIAIAFKKSWFRRSKEHMVDLDRFDVDLPRQCDTANVALILELQSDKANVPNLVVGTTHLYWHPKASYERTRQMYCLLKKCEELDTNEPIILGGDFNSEPFDPPYLYATGHFQGTRIADGIMRESLTTPEFGCDDSPPAAPGAQESPTLSSNHARLQSQRPTLIKRDSQIDMASRRVKYAFMHHPLTCVSLYSDYHKIDWDNSQLPGEPQFTNWTDSFAGALDYLFLVMPKDRPLPLQVLKLLKLPAEYDFEPEPNGLPRRDVSPSDHFAIMAEVRFS